MKYIDLTRSSDEQIVNLAAILLDFAKDHYEKFHKLRSFGIMPVAEMQSTLVYEYIERILDATDSSQEDVSPPLLSMETTGPAYQRQGQDGEFWDEEKGEELWMQKKSFIKPEA